MNGLPFCCAILPSLSLTDSLSLSLNLSLSLSLSPSVFVGGHSLSWRLNGNFWPFPFRRGFFCCILFLFCKAYDSYCIRASSNNKNGKKLRLTSPCLRFKSHPIDARVRPFICSSVHLLDPAMHVLLLMLPWRPLSHHHLILIHVHTHMHAHQLKQQTQPSL